MVRKGALTRSVLGVASHFIICIALKRGGLPGRRAKWFTKPVDRAVAELFRKRPDLSWLGHRSLLQVHLHVVQCVKLPAGLLLQCPYITHADCSWFLSKPLYSLYFQPKNTMTAGAGFHGRRELFNDPPGVSITIGDQGSADFWTEFARSNPVFDIILDDGNPPPPPLRLSFPHICRMS